MAIQSNPGNEPILAPLPAVCVVDDDPDLLTFFSDLADLGHFGLLGTYTTAREALTHLPHCRPDVVFMDVRLPDMTGIECTKRLTTILPKLQIVVITGHPEQSLLIQALRAGAAGFVVKPCTVDETLSAIAVYFAAAGLLATKPTR